MKRCKSSFGQSAKCGAKCFLRCRDALAGPELRVPAGNQRFGLAVERAQQLAFPAVPDARSDRADVGDGQHQQQLEAFRALHDIGEVAHGLGITDVAAEGDLAHGEMLLDQPGRRFDLGGRQAQARTQAARNARADDGVVFVAALGDVVQKGRDIQRTPVLHRVDNSGGERM